MRPLARQILSAAAASAGLESRWVEDMAKKPSKILDLLPRMDIETLDEEITRTPRLFAILPDPDDARYALRRHLVFTRRMFLSAVIKAKTEEEQERLCNGVLLALPKWTKDEGGNLVRIKGQRVTRAGFERLMVEVFPQKEAALHLIFEGGLYRDEKVPLIRDVNLIDLARPPRAYPKLPGGPQP